MNTENRYPVTASLFMLRETKRRQEQVRRGYQLLKRKVEALRFKGRLVAHELTSTQAVIGHTLGEAYMCLAAVKFSNGESNAFVLENVGEAQIRVQRVQENISGVSTVSLHAAVDPSAADPLQYSGLGAGGSRTAEAKRVFRQAIKTLVRFASLRNSCRILDDAIRSTLRKVNGIEKVIIPKLQNTERYILTEMDEREREEFHRLKMTKAKKIRAKALAAAARAASPALALDAGDAHHHGVQPLAPIEEANRILSSIERQRIDAEREVAQALLLLGNNIGLMAAAQLRIAVALEEQNGRNENKNNNEIVAWFGPQLRRECPSCRLCLLCSPQSSLTAIDGGAPVCYPHNWDDEDLLF